MHVHTCKTHFTKGGHSMMNKIRNKTMTKEQTSRVTNLFHLLLVSETSRTFDEQNMQE